MVSRQSTVAQADRPVRVFSVQWAILGQHSYAKALRQQFSKEQRVRLQSTWLLENRELWTRALFQVAGFKTPSQWVIHRNIDFHWYRRVMCHSLFGRRLVDRRLQSSEPWPDVLHFNTQEPAYSSLKYMRQVPTVITTDQTAHQAMRYALRSGFEWTGAPNYRREKKTMRLASQVVFWSEWARKSAVEQHGLEKSKTHVIAPGVPAEEFNPALSTSASEPGGPFRLLFVGNDFERKGGADLLTAFAAAFGGEAELHLVTNDDLGPVPAAAANVHVHQGVRAYTPEWFRLYREADVFVLPTHFDPFGLVYIEAQAAGLPVIGTHTNAVPEIVKEGETGILVAPGDCRALASAMRTLHGDAALRRRMGIQARARAVEKFDSAKQFSALADVFVAAASA